MAEKKQSVKKQGALKGLQAAIDYNFAKEGLFVRALTHPSKGKDNYQRLEFLGDSILDFIVGEYVFAHSDKQEGQLTVLRSAIVCEENLAKVFDELELEKFVIAGKSLQFLLTDAIKVDIIESLIAAIYLDGGLQAARDFIESKTHVKDFENVPNDNFKSQLQELIQANFKCSMKYVTEPAECGFEAKFFMDEDLIATGYGKDKTKAEQNCACVAIHKLFVE